MNREQSTPLLVSLLKAQVPQHIAAMTPVDVQPPLQHRNTKSLLLGLLWKPKLGAFLDVTLTEIRKCRRQSQRNRHITNQPGVPSRAREGEGGSSQIYSGPLQLWSPGKKWALLHKTNTLLMWISTGLLFRRTLNCCSMAYCSIVLFVHLFFYGILAKYENSAAEASQKWFHSFFDVSSHTKETA